VREHTEPQDLVAEARVLLHSAQPPRRTTFNPIADQRKDSGKIYERRGGSARPYR